MSIFYGLFIAYLFATPYILFTNGDEIQVEIDADANARQSLDEISKEVNAMKAELTNNNNDGNDPVSDGDNGNSQRAALGEVEKIKKIAEILETVVLPTIVNRQNAQEQLQYKGADSAASLSSDPIKILPKGFKLLQHHSAITSNLDDGGQRASNQKSNPQSDDN